MTCYHPNNAHVTGTRSTGTKIIEFGLPKSSEHEAFLLPCGQCIGCRLDRSIQWAARCMHEAQMHPENQFITLTYDTEPENGSLHPPDFTNFMHKYRKHLNRGIPEFLPDCTTPNPAFTKIRFYHGAEYGDELHRPHHHACIFGHDFTDKEIYRECEGIITYYSPTLEKLWGHGFCTTSDLTLQSAAYVARYCMKKITASDQSEDKYHEHYQTTCPITGEIVDRVPEYATMSRNPGIGKQWFDLYHSDIFPHDTTIYKGKNIKTPRYYENLLRSSDIPAFEALKSIRKIKAQTPENQYQNSPSRLRAREAVKKATLNQLNRKLHDS